MHRLAAFLTMVMVLGAASIAAPEILSNRLIEHIKVLSSDEMKGRGNGGPELDRAADYIRNQFKAAGLQPGWKGEWIQPFELIAGLTIGQQNTLTID